MKMLTPTSQYNACTIEMPWPFEDSAHSVIEGNYLARKISGQGNGGKVSWSVHEVIWFFGEFVGPNVHNCNDVEFIHNLVLSQYGIKPTVINRVLGDTEQATPYVILANLGEMDKRSARKLVKELNAGRGHTVMYSRMATGAALKHCIELVDTK